MLKTGTGVTHSANKEH